MKWFLEHRSWFVAGQKNGAITEIGENGAITENYWFGPDPAGL